MDSQEIEVTREQLLERAESMSQKVMHLSAHAAWGKIQQGEYEGTLFASKMAQIFFLLGDDSELPIAAE
jgi:hypothetical protein